MGSEDDGSLSNFSLCDTWKLTRHHVSLTQDEHEMNERQTIFTIWRDGRKRFLRVYSPKVIASDCDLADGMEMIQPNYVKGTCNKLLCIQSSLQSLSVSNVKFLSYREMRSTNGEQLDEVIMNSHRGPCWHPHNVITREVWQFFIQQATAVSN